MEDSRPGRPASAGAVPLPFALRLFDPDASGPSCGRCRAEAPAEQLISDGRRKLCPPCFDVALEEIRRINRLRTAK